MSALEGNTSRVNRDLIEILTGFDLHSYLLLFPFWVMFWQQTVSCKLNLDGVIGRGPPVYWITHPRAGSDLSGLLVHPDRIKTGKARMPAEGLVLDACRRFGPGKVQMLLASLDTVHLPSGSPLGGGWIT